MSEGKSAGGEVAGVSALEGAFARGEFVVTCELSPPKGSNLTPLVEKAEGLKGVVQAFNLTDSAAARMTMDAAAAGHALVQRGIEPIVQVTSRDKNRLALQSGMLGAYALGVRNLVVMGGDPPSIGDHPEAKGVNDLFSSQIVEAARGLGAGKDFAGNALDGGCEFFVGSVCNPGVGGDRRAAEVENTRRKVAAGARFLQTQAIYQGDAFARFVDEVGGDLRAGGVRVCAGIIPIKSVKMAEYMNARVPGIDIPKALVGRIAEAEKRGGEAVVEESLAIAAETIGELRAGGGCDGLHVMAIGWERYVPMLLERAGVGS